jgi:hypothetical protein
MDIKKDGVPEERRCTVRDPYPCTVSFTALGNSHNLPTDIEKPAEIIDISNDGMRIGISDQFLRVGSIIKVRVPIQGKKTAIPVLAEVRWISEKKTDDYHSGLRFL